MSRVELRIVFQDLFRSRHTGMVYEQLANRQVIRPADQPPFVFGEGDDDRRLALFRLLVLLGDGRLSHPQDLAQE